jgi:hypothetical protein
MRSEVCRARPEKMGEKSLILSEFRKKHTSGAKAPVDLAGSDARAKALACHPAPFNGRSLPPAKERMGWR